MNLRRQVDTLRCGNRVVLVSAPFFILLCVRVCLQSISTFLNILLIIKMESVLTSFVAYFYYFCGLNDR